MIKVWHISDSHNFHNQYFIPENVDLVIFSGDCSESIVEHENEREIYYFMDWFSNLPAEKKIFVAGNHDLAIQSGRVPREAFLEYNITYLENDFTFYRGLQIWGSPVSPHFEARASAFCVPRLKTEPVWQNIPSTADIVVTHGPPAGMLDLSWGERGLEQVGDRYLAKYIRESNANLHLFGHVHDAQDLNNFGIRKKDGIIYSNATGVITRRRDLGLVNNTGNLFEIDLETKRVTIIQ